MASIAVTAVLNIRRPSFVSFESLVILKKVGARLGRENRWRKEG